MRTEDIRPTLAAAIGFTQAELDANRTGQFSAAQREDLEQRVAYYKNAWQRSWGWVDPTWKGRRSRALWMTTFSLMLVISVAAYARRASQAGGMEVLAEVLVGTLCWAVTLAFLGWGLSRFIRGHRPRGELVLRSAEGTARHSSEESGGWGADILLVHIGEVGLPVPAEVQQSFVPGQRYRVFYADNPNPLVLSAEPIGM
jgi:hypothetical protein